jgi:glycerate 2-kinase
MKPSFAQYRSHLSLLQDAALRAADPAAAVRRSLAAAELACMGRIFVVGAGKAGAAMAAAAEEILGDRIAAGVVSVPSLPPEGLHRLELIAGGHPVPTAGSLLAGEKIMQLLQIAAEEDLVLVLLSGGGSAMMEFPQPELSLEDIQKTNVILLKSGAAIREFNCLRTPLSQIKGGGLARMASPARVVCLILSDVVGNSLETIASGPTVYRKYPAEEIEEVLRKYHLRGILPLPVLDCLELYALDAPNPLPPDLRVENRIIASNRMAGEAAAAAAGGLGFRPAHLSDDWQGEAWDAGKRFAELLLRESGRGPACCIAGGETTVAVRGKGKGGRNQEAALAAAIVLEGKPDIALAVLATDGVDGPTEAAGAIVTGQSAARARRMGMDPDQYLVANNSYPFFESLGDLIVTGPTGTNVNDLFIGLVY